MNAPTRGVHPPRRGAAVCVGDDAGMAHPSPTSPDGQDRYRDVQIALVHAVLAIAAGIVQLGEGNTVA